MPLQLTTAFIRSVFPKAPAAIIAGLKAHQDKLADAGILDSPERLAMCLANVGHECAGLHHQEPDREYRLHPYEGGAGMARFKLASAVTAKYGHIRSAGSAIFKDASPAAGLPYFNPHSFRRQKSIKLGRKISAMRTC